MLLDNSPPDGMYNDIKQNFITEMTLRQFIKMKKNLEKMRIKLMKLQL